MEKRHGISKGKLLALLMAGAAVAAVLLEVMEKNLVPDHIWDDFLVNHEELHS